MSGSFASMSSLPLENPSVRIGESMVGTPRIERVLGGNGFFRHIRRGPNSGVE
jgi:hypothetical protein